ncbi:hypothetical protein L6164_009381 [Bauhinia variegata]|uniref:Uncharacterized protein n=1 Tax=Bauhinia variegata TaxID=167791 RepID=A0ACB9PJH7_BAUVA|nr:hypothetical protein L6164_009381 [Bauhinia variegata]
MRRPIARRTHPPAVSSLCCVQTEPLTRSGRRSICSNCSRPFPVCLCHLLPAQSIQITTQVVILFLHHPHEVQHKLFTTPILNETSDFIRDKGKDSILIAFDGTWNHAREMVKASEEFCHKGLFGD